MAGWLAGWLAGWQASIEAVWKVSVPTGSAGSHAAVTKSAGLPLTFSHMRARPFPGALLLVRRNLCLHWIRSHCHLHGRDDVLPPQAVDLMVGNNIQKSDCALLILWQVRPGIASLCRYLLG